MCVLAWASSGLTAEPTQRQPSPRELATYWAPVIVQDLEVGRHREGYLTRFDYDGDWRATNNLANADSFDLPAYAYYWVAESSSHAFVGYGLYHIAGTYLGEQYENGMLGMVVVVEKSFTGDHPMGRFVALMTAAQSVVQVAAERDAEIQVPTLDVKWNALTAPSRRLAGKEDTTVQDVDFAVDEHGLHPVVYGQALGTGLASSTTITTGERPAHFDERRVTDWRDREWGTKVYPDQRRGRGGFLKLDQDGVVFRFQGEAQVTVAAGTRGRGRYPHHWEVIGYDLLPLDELRQRRDDYRSGKITFEDDGVFTGAGPRGPGARAPWGWAGPAGDVYHDPGKLVDERVDGLGDFSAAVTTLAVE
jgi:hypothetical protein